MKTLLILMMPLLLLSACKDDANVITEPVKAVKTITISEGSKANSRQISGIVKTANESDLSFRVSGRVASVDVKTGDNVTKGQVLAKLEQKTYLLDVQSAKAKLASARADLLEKSDDLKRQKNLKKKDFVPQASVDKAQAAYTASNSNVAVAKTVLDSAQNDLGNTTLKAPFDGAIAARSIEAFTEISAGKTMFQLQSGDGFKVEVLMPETLIRDVSHGDTVSISFPTLKDTIVSGTVSEIGAKAESGNAFPVKATLEKSPSEVRAGMTAEVSFNFGEATETSVYLIPVSALDVRVPPASEKFVEGTAPLFVFNAEKGIAEKRMVKIRDMRGNKLEVIGGLKAGDIVIVAGVPFINDGQNVKLWNASYSTPAIINVAK